MAWPNKTVEPNLVLQALMHAAHGAQKFEMVKCLLEGGANPKLKDAAGEIRH